MVTSVFVRLFWRILTVPGLQQRNPHRAGNIQLDVTRIFAFLCSSFVVMFVALSVCASKKREICSLDVLVCPNTSLLSSCYFYDR